MAFVGGDERLCSPRNSNKHITHTDPGHKIHSFRKRRKSPYTANMILHRSLSIHSFSHTCCACWQAC